ncbi:hypothetical protein C4573_07170 [Candidatus Woesearchaeota archaeon]|nr:MAG: hypothetical protein C4573_07170 [Candidatus Woesearchaeota archaeon]
MNEYLLVIAFLLGVVLQAYLSIRHENKKNFLIALGLLPVYFIILLIYHAITGKPIVPFTILMCILLFMFAFYGYYKKVLLPRIDETQLLVNTLIFWYFIFAIVSSNTARVLLMILAAMPTLLILNSTFSKRVISKRAKIFLYIWNLFALVIILLTQFFSKVFHVAEGNQHPAMQIITLFIFGIFTFYVSMQTIPLISILPNKNSGTRETKEHIDLFFRKYADDQITISVFFILAIGLGAMFIINQSFSIISPILLINLLLLLLPNLLAHIKPQSF